jgi:hypothetical protein
VVLYHFTKLMNVPGIKADGLRPSSESENSLGKDVVWLTELTTRRLTDTARAEMNSWHWLPVGNGRNVMRFTVRIGSHDRKLVRYEPWLRRQKLTAGHDTDCGRAIVASWWMYFGVIHPSRIIECIAESDTEAMISG